MGCHRYEGYDKEPEDLNSIGQQIKQIETQKKDNIKQNAYLMKQADAAESNEEANKLNTQAVDLRVANSKLDARLQQLDYQSHSLMQDQKKVGPNLKDVRLKLNKNWIPVWLKKPSDFRPTTKMPNFRLNDHQIQAISAYIWQSGFTDELPKHKPGNAAHGKELFETRGCLACHSIGEGDQMQGGVFSANLTRVGEKANYDYLVRWIHNARQRTRPYCPYEKKDIGPEDYAKKGLPYQFDLDHSKCPNDGHELQVQNMTVMPSLRLSPEDAEDIATYSDDSEEAGAVILCGRGVHGRSGSEGRRQEVGAPFRLRGMPRDCRLRRRRTHRHRVDCGRQQADRASRLRAVHRSRHNAAARTPSRSRTRKIWRGCPTVLRKSPGTTTKDSSSTNWRSPTFTIRAR